MPQPVRVLVRASDPITQAGLAAQLGGRPDIEIVTEPVRVLAAVTAGASVGMTAGGGVGVTVDGAFGRPVGPGRAEPAGAHRWPAAQAVPEASRTAVGTVAGSSAVASARTAAVRLAAAPTAEPAAGRLPADVVLVSAEAVDESTLRIVREIQHGGVPVVLVVAELDSHDITAAIDAGVVGLLRRAGATPDTVVAAVRGAAAGDGYLPPDLLGPLLRQVRQVSTQVLAPRGLTFSGLSERELTVLRLVSEGLDTREIGRQLCYSERTVKNVLQDVTRRFGLRNRSHAVAYAFRHGLL